MSLTVGVARGALAQAVGSPPSADALPPAAVARPGTSSATPDVAVEDIVVTAQRRSENLQKVPIAITALSSLKLENANIQSTADLTSITPAITLSATVGFLEPRIRGIGNSSAGPGVENSVATYVDGVYISSSPGSLLSLDTVERIEVLKGPQGTLFGRNATAGLISIITKDPSNNFSGDAHVGYGSFDTVHGDAYVTGPIADGVAADLAVSVGHQGTGYGTNLSTGADINQTKINLSGRTKWLARIGDSTTLRFSADASRIVSSDPTPAALSGTAATAYRTPPPASAPIIQIHNPRDAYLNEYPIHTSTSGGVSLKADHDFGGVALSVTTAYRFIDFYERFDADASPAAQVYEYYNQRDHQFSQEVQLSSKGTSRFRWIVGAYYFNLQSKYDPFVLVFGPPATQSFSIMKDYLSTDSVAGYAQATWEFLPGTRLTGGFRYTTEERKISGNRTAITTAGISTTTPLADGRFRNNVPTWRVSLDHDFTPEVLGYASWNRGFKSGGYNAQAPAQAPYQPEHLDAYEAGVKATLFDHRLRVNGAAFLYDYSDIQVNTFVGSLGVIYNGAKARVYGLDFDLDLAVTDALSLTGGFVALHDRFTNFPVAVVATSNGNGTVSLAPGSATGNRLPFAPDVTASIGATYKFDLGPGTASLTANELHSTGFHTQPDNYYRQGAYDTVNMSLTWRPRSERYSLKAWVNNLTDNAVYAILSATSSFQFVSYQAPRTFGGTVGVKF